MNYFNRILNRNLKNASLYDIRPAITPVSIPEIPSTRFISQTTLRHTIPFVASSIKRNEQSDKGTMQPSTNYSKSTEIQEPSELFDTKSEFKHDPIVHDVDTFNNANNMSENDHSNSKELPQIPKPNVIFPHRSISIPYNQNSNSKIDQNHTKTDQFDNYQYDTPPSYDNYNDVKSHSLNTQKKYPHTIKELDYFSKKIKLFVQDASTQSSSSSSHNDDYENRQGQYDTSHRLIPQPKETDSPKKNEKNDVSSKPSNKPHKEDFKVMYYSSPHEIEIFAPEIKKPTTPSSTIQGKSNNNEYKNRASHTTITVNIGRIEVRSSPAGSAALNPKYTLNSKNKFSPTVSLAEYLRQRSKQD